LHRHRAPHGGACAVLRRPRGVHRRAGAAFTGTRAPDERRSGMTEPRKKTPSEKIGLSMMVAGFVVLLVAGVCVVLQTRGTLPPGSAPRHLLIVGLGVYFVGRILFRPFTRRR